MAMKKRKTFPWQPKNQFLYNLMSSSPGVIIINWIFQGILGMELSERIFKIGFDMVLTTAFAFAFSSVMSLRLAVLIGFAIAHTINWIFNGHVLTLRPLRSSGVVRTPPQEIWDYMRDLGHRVQTRSFLSGVVVFGAVSRGEGVRETSDVDMRFIRESGFRNGVLANFYALYERTRAVFHWFPLDLYVYDSPDSLNRLREDEQPIILYDPKGLLKEKYKQRGFESLSSAYLQYEKTA